MASRRITKEMARLAAFDMRDAVYKKKKTDAREALNNELDIFVKKYFPAPVLACVTEYKKYFKTTNSIHLRAYKTRLPDGTYDGCSYKSIFGKLSIDMPAQASSWDSDVLNVLESECESVVKANTYYEDLVRESDSFCSKVEDTLLSLRTEKKITEQFPEALPYIKFPDDKNNLPSPIFSDIRAMLQSVTNNKQ